MILINKYFVKPCQIVKTGLNFNFVIYMVNTIFLTTKMRIYIIEKEEIRNIFILSYALDFI